METGSLEVKEKEQTAEEREIQVAFGLTDPKGTFSRWVGSAMASILMNTDSPICFHILLDDTVNEDNRKKLKQTGNTKKSRVVFHEMDSSKFAIENKWLEIYTIGSLYRLILPEILPERKKIIYLDADVIFNCNIRELWQIDVSEYCIAGVSDADVRAGIVRPSVVLEGSVKKEQYFNSGVVVMNLERIRQQGGLLKPAINFMKNRHETKLPDQDALNDIFRNSVLLLEEKWNCPVRLESKKTNKLRKVVYHFMGQKHPCFDNLTEYDKLLLKVQGNSPWGYNGIEADLIRGMNMMSFKIEQLQKLICKLSAPGIKRIYYGLNTDGMKNIMKMVPPRNVDYCIEKDPIDVDGMRYGVPVRDVNEVRREQKGTFVVFVLPEADGGQGIQKLNEMGLKYGEDFFVVPALLKVSQGGYIV